METPVLERAAEAVSARAALRPLVVSVERPGPGRFVLVLEAGEFRARLVLDVDPAHPTFHLVPSGRESWEPTGGGFGERLPGARLVAVEPGSEPRIRVLRFLPRGGSGERVIVAAWTGRTGNLHLLDEDGIVIESLSSGGPRPNERYLPPAPDRRPGLRDLDPEQLAAQLAAQPVDAWPKAIARACRDVAVVVAAEVVVRAEHAEGSGTESIELARSVLHLLGEQVPAGGEPRLYLFARRPDPPFAALPAAFVSLRALPAFAESEAPPLDLMAALARAHEANLARSAEDLARGEAIKMVDAESARLIRLRANLLKERADPQEGLRLRRSGEAILARMNEIRKGLKELLCRDYSSEKDVLRIALDPAKTPAENAQDYFRRARRWERGEPHRKRRLEEIDRATARLSILRSKLVESDTPWREPALSRRITEALGTLARAQRPAPAEEPAGRRSREAGREGGRGAASAEGKAARNGRTDGGGGRSAGRGTGDREAGRAAGTPGSRARERESRFRPRNFTIRDGWTVLVGRSNEENDYLTHRLARPDDYWFHAHGAPGSHVVLRREGRKDNPSAKSIEEAAAIAAFYSKARHSGRTPVIYTEKKYVRKPRGGKPGLALCTREKMVMVAPKDPTEGQEPEWMEE